MARKNSLKAHEQRTRALMAAPMAAGKPKPIVPRPPDDRKLRGASRSTLWAAHIWCCPTSVTTTLF